MAVAKAAYQKYEVLPRKCRGAFCRPRMWIKCIGPCKAIGLPCGPITQQIWAKGAVLGFKKPQIHVSKTGHNNKKTTHRNDMFLNIQ